MSGHYRKQTPEARKKRAQRRRDTSFVRNVSPVTVTHADGTVETKQPYSTQQLRQIDRKAASQPRTWDEINSWGGGGQDRNFIT